MPSEMTVTATEANRSFSKLLRAARDGTRVTITSQGSPVAMLLPVVSDDSARFEAARAEFLARLEAQPIIQIEPWTREELYDRNA